MKNELFDALEDLELVSCDLEDSREMLEYVMEYFEDENPTNNRAHDVYMRVKCFGNILLDRLCKESERVKSAFEAAHKAAEKKEAK